MNGKKIGRWNVLGDIEDIFEDDKGIYIFRNGKRIPLKRPGPGSVGPLVEDKKGGREHGKQ